jgi:non-canonical (house-cleaning) NTP pyrophosphatase
MADDLIILLNEERNAIANVIQTNSLVVTLETGIPGSDGTFLQNAIEIVATSNGQQEIDIDPGVGFVLVYINGLMQRQSTYSISSGILTLPPSLSIEIGDLITILY